MMFIREIEINNYRALKQFNLSDIAVPDKENAGSGLNVILGENGCGKTSILDAIALGLNSYKVDGFSIHDLSETEVKADVILKAESSFKVKKLFSGDFRANGLRFNGYIRTRASGSLDRTIVTQSLLLSDEIEEGKPDLRADLKGTFSEPRYQQEYQIIDVDFRVGPIASGSINKTEFDRFLEHLNYHYVKDVDDKTDINELINIELQKTNQSTALSAAVKSFNQQTELNVELRHIRDGELFSNSFLAQRSDENRFIPINRMGRGYQLLLALLVKKELAKSKKYDLVVMLDEAEMHLHPLLQQLLVKELLDLSKTAQIFITSHSPIFVHELLQEDKEKASRKHLIKRSDNGSISVVEVDAAVLPRITPAEINYLAFNYPTLEYHNELYGYLSYIKQLNIRELDRAFNVDERDEYNWERDDVERADRLSIHSILRNAFHHKENQRNTYCNDEFIRKNLQGSIEFLREYIKREMLEVDND